MAAAWASREWVKWLKAQSLDRALQTVASRQCRCKNIFLLLEQKLLSKVKKQKKLTFNCWLIHNFVITWIRHACVSSIQFFPSFLDSSFTKKGQKRKSCSGIVCVQLSPPSLPSRFCTVYLPCVQFITFFPRLSLSLPPSLPSIFFQHPFISLSLSVFLSLVSRWEIPVLNVWWHHLVQNAGKWARGHLFNLLIELLRVSTPSLPSPPQSPPSPLAVWFMAYWRRKREAHFHFAWVKALHYSRKYRLPWPCERILHCDSLRLMNLLITFSYDWRSGQQLLYCDTAWMLHPLRCDSGKIAPKHTSKQLHEFNSYCQKANNSGGE